MGVVSKSKLLMCTPICGSPPCDEFRALCSYGIPLGAPANLAQMSPVAGSDTLMAFDGLRLGAKIPMTREQKQLQCISACRKASPDYTQYMLADDSACLCTKVDVPASEDPKGIYIVDIG